MYNETIISYFITIGNALCAIRIDIVANSKYSIKKYKDVKDSSGINIDELHIDIKKEWYVDGCKVSFVCEAMYFDFMQYIDCILNNCSRCWYFKGNINNDANEAGIIIFYSIGDYSFVALNVYNHETLFNIESFRL